MILDHLKNWRRYAALSELKAAFEFLEQRAGGKDLADGRVEIDGERLFALVQSYEPKPAAQGKFESHRQYADVQFMASGVEMIGWAPADSLEVEQPYDADKDIAFYRQPEHYTPLALHAGTFAVFYPEDAHMPCCRLDAHGPVRKIVVKVRLSPQRHVPSRGD